MNKVLIIDDDKDMCKLLSDIILSAGHKPFDAQDGQKAIKAVRTHAPDIVLLDIKLPGMDGMMVLEEIKAIDESLLVVMLTGYGDIKDAVKAIKLGAFDYITKPFENDDIIEIINNALSARKHSSPGVALSLREKEVINWLKKGKNSADVSIILEISERTVNYHVNNIMNKLDAVSRTHAISLAIEQGLISGDKPY